MNKPVIPMNSSKSFARIAEKVETEKALAKKQRMKNVKNNRSYRRD